MRITVRLDDGLLEQAKAMAHQQNKNLTSLIEEGLRLVIANTGAPSRQKKIVLPVSREREGVFPGVGLDNNVDLLDLLEERY